MKRLFYCLLISLLFFSCTSRPEPIKITGSSIGTIYHITYFDSQNRNFSVEIQDILEQVMKSCNIFDTNSTISRINANKSNELDHITKELLLKSIEISDKTGGNFDVTAGVLVNLWGFGPLKNREKEVTKAEIDSLMKLVGYRKIRIEDNQIIKEHPEIMINFGAIAKGYAVDLVAKFLDSKGINSYLVEIGGEIFTRGTKPNRKDWIVGISVPDENNPYNSDYQSKVILKNKGLATSGNYRNFYKLNEEKRVHTISPLTGYPVENELLSVTVIAEDCMTADAFATAIMVMGKDKSIETLKKESNLEAYFIYLENDSLKTFATAGF